ncbi:MAG: trypsin-like peptidase domain-containing protein [Desulfatitalea sp.]|nr:serine protease [Desulfatitalea sp.]NNK01339.1 trypsin-like peptidase domain-containing protein [Desulfatitalea sp.]
MKFGKLFAIVVLLFVPGLVVSVAMENALSSTQEELVFIFQKPVEGVPLLNVINDILKQKGYRTIELKPSVSRNIGSIKPVNYATGFFISEMGHFLTNHHVIQKANTIFLRTVEGETIEAKVLAEDIKDDIAILSLVEEKRVAHWLALGEFTKESVGKKIKILGYPFPAVLKRPSMATGIISKANGVLGNQNSLQISAPIHPGNSGSPILDENNLVVGIVNEQWFGNQLIETNKPLPPYLNFGVNVNFAKPMITQLKIDNQLSSNEKTVSISDAEQATALVMVNTNDVGKQVLLPGKGRLVMIQLERLNGFDLICYTAVQLNEEKPGNIASETKQGGCIVGGPKIPCNILAQKILVDIENILDLKGIGVQASRQ